MIGCQLPTVLTSTMVCTVKVFMACIRGAGTLCLTLRGHFDCHYRAILSGNGRVLGGLWL